MTTRRVAAVVVLSAGWETAAGLRHGSLDLGYMPETFVAGAPRVAFAFFAGLLLFRCWRAGRLPPCPRLGWAGLPLFAASLVAAGYSHSATADLLVVFIVVPIVPLLLSAAALVEQRLDGPVRAALARRLSQRRPRAPVALAP